MHRYDTHRHLENSCIRCIISIWFNKNAKSNIHKCVHQVGTSNGVIFKRRHCDLTGIRLNIGKSSPFMA